MDIPMRSPVGVPRIRDETLELLGRLVNRLHFRQAQGPEMRVDGVDWVPVFVCEYGGGYQFRGDFLWLLYR